MYSLMGDETENMSRILEWESQHQIWKTDYKIVNIIFQHFQITDSVSK